MSVRRKKRHALPAASPWSRRFVESLKVAAIFGTTTVALYVWVPVSPPSQQKVLSPPLASSPSRYAHGVSVEDARRNPSSRQQYLDQIMEGSGYKALYDPTRGLCVNRQLVLYETYVNPHLTAEIRKHLQKMFVPSPSAYANVCSNNFSLGRNVAETIFVHPPVFESGAQFQPDGSFSILHDAVGLERVVFRVQTDEDAKSIILGHEATHVRDIRNGVIVGNVVLDGGAIASFSGSRDDGFFDHFMEVRGFSEQLIQYKGGMSDLLWADAYAHLEAEAQWCYSRSPSSRLLRDALQAYKPRVDTALRECRPPRFLARMQ